MTSSPKKGKKIRHTFDSLARMISAGFDDVYKRFDLIDLRFNKIESKLDEHSRILDEHSRKLDEHSRKLDEHSRKLDEHAQQLEEHTMTISRKVDQIDLTELNRRVTWIENHAVFKPRSAS